nr:4-coumarate--CoA ligase 1-like [Leptinotarsa decemlineata]
MNSEVISGGRSSFEKDFRGFGEFFFEQADKFSDKACQIDGLTGQQETYSNVKKRSARLALHMERLGIVPGDIIISCMKNSMNSVIPHIGTLCLGAIMSAVDPTQSKREWTHCAKILKPKLIFVDEDVSEEMAMVVESLQEKPELIVVGKSKKFKTFADLQIPLPEEQKFKPITINNCHSTALIIFSSGTTGLPKGICLSHFSIINEMKNALYFIRQPAVSLNYATFYWISAILVLMSTFHYGGARLILPKFDAEELLRKIEEHKITFIFMPPLYTFNLTNVKNSEKYDTSSLRILVIAGSSVSPTQLIRTKKLFKYSLVAVAYGTTEAGGFITITGDKEFEDNHSTIGKPVKDIDLKIIDPATGKLLGPNQKGEICIKSLYGMTGYYNMDSSPYFDDEGFIKSGDLGYYDDNGCFYIVERIKEMFKYKSWHVVPSFVESILMEHPAVLESGVFGLPHEVDEYHPAACVVLKDTASVDLDEIQSFVSNNVSEWQRLRGGIKVVENLPRTPSSKIQRSKLVELFLSS